jgi:plastocyanin
MKLAITMLIALAVAGSAVAAPNMSLNTSATLTIKHQTRGCHSWSFDGKSWHATQTIKIVRGGVVAVVNHDVMPHQLIQVSGPKAAVAGMTMGHMHASAQVAFPAKGTYVFKTRAGEDYMKGIKTIGADNVLKLVVAVT